MPSGLLERDSLKWIRVQASVTLDAFEDRPFCPLEVIPRGAETIQVDLTAYRNSGHAITAADGELLSASAGTSEFAGSTKVRARFSS